MMLRKITAVVIFFIGAENAAFAQAPGDKEYECLSLLAVLPAMQLPEMRDAIKPEDSSAIYVTRLRELAEGGIGDAQYTLGVLFQSGSCLPKDMSRALEWHTKAAENGVANAQRILAVNYHLGTSAPPMMRLDVSEDPVRAYMWFMILNDKSNLQSLRERLTASQVAEAERLANEWLANHPKPR